MVRWLSQTPLRGLNRRYFLCLHRCRAKWKSDRFQSSSPPTPGRKTQASRIPGLICFAYRPEPFRNAPCHTEGWNHQILTFSICRVDLAAKTKQTSEFAAPQTNQYPPGYSQSSRGSTGSLKRGSLCFCFICSKTYPREGGHDLSARKFTFSLSLLLSRVTVDCCEWTETNTRTNGLFFCETP